MNDWIKTNYAQLPKRFLRMSGSVSIMKYEEVKTRDVVEFITKCKTASFPSLTFTDTERRIRDVIILLYIFCYALKSLLSLPCRHDFRSTFYDGSMMLWLFHSIQWCVFKNITWYSLLPFHLKHNQLFHCFPSKNNCMQAQTKEREEKKFTGEMTKMTKI